MSRCVALLVAAPASRQGKTTLTAALARLHRRQGRRVQVFKCGPDFLDPHWHQLASGQPVYQLDLWINGEADVRARLHQAAQQNDILLIEGVMGLYDGQPSAADIARRFGIPVLCIVSAAAMAGTFGALAWGLQHYPAADGSRLPWAGVIANHVGSPRHAQMLADSVPDGSFCGHLPRHAGFTLPERHLGLVPAQELADAEQRLDAVADALADTRLGQLPWQAEAGTPCWQDWAVELADPQLPALPPLLQGRTIAIARDAALCFVYQANLDTLQALGARLRFFSPLADEPLPACDALWLPGGYPELHADTLARATRARDSVAAHIAAGKPVWAECGGMLLLMASVTLQDGSRHPLWDLLPGSVQLQPRLVALGSQQLDWGQGVLRGHTFHHSRCATPLPVLTHSTRPDSTEPVEALYRQGSVMASYFHAWFASCPTAAAALFQGQA